MSDTKLSTLKCSLGLSLPPLLQLSNFELFKYERHGAQGGKRPRPICLIPEGITRTRLPESVGSCGVCAHSSCAKILYFIKGLLSSFGKAVRGQIFTRFAGSRQEKTAETIQYVQGFCRRRLRQEEYVKREDLRDAD